MAQRITFLTLLSLFAFTSLTFTSLTGCKVFDESLLDRPSALPLRPDIPDNGSDTGEQIFAITNVQLNNSVDWRNTGRDLDGFITSSSVQIGECVPPDSAVKLPTDGTDGIDNALGTSLIGLVNDAYEDETQTGSRLENEVRSTQSKGDGTLLLWLQGWNGEADDSNVTITMLVAADGTSSTQTDVQWDMAASKLVLASDTSVDAADPTGSADDTFWVRSDSYNGSTPFHRDANGYISDGVFVFQLAANEDIPFNAGTGHLNIAMSDGYIVGTMDTSCFGGDCAGFNSGFISGRYSKTKLLGVGEDLGICSNGMGPSSIEMAFDGLLDVLETAPDTSTPSSTQVCTAMSVGVPFEGRAVTIARDTDNVEDPQAIKLVEAADFPLGCPPPQT